MIRREFITLLGGAAAAIGPLRANAQQPSIRPLIGLLSPLSAPAASRNVTAFRSALRDLGYLEGRNVTLAIRYADGAPQLLPQLADELVALNPDVIVSGAQSGALAVYNATQKIPIVVVMPEDPVESGLANSIARPGRNVTGMWGLGGDGKRLDFFKLAVPGLARIGLIMNPDDATDRAQIPRFIEAAPALSLSLQIIEAKDPSKLDALGTHIEQANVQGLLFGQSPLFLAARAQVATIAARLNLPALYAWREFVDVGGLMSFGPNLPDMYRQLARLVGRILKGERPAELPFELPTRFELILNLKTAKAMGLAISDSFVLLADEVIE
jgi:putative ABC transport system substrate-binding protein